MHTSTIIAALLPLVAAAPASLPKRASPAPIRRAAAGTVIEHSYIVKLKDPAKNATVAGAEFYDTARNNVVSQIQEKPKAEYNGAFQGFAATLTPSELTTLQDDPHVDFIEEDAVVSIAATQYDAPWGLARLSSPYSPSSRYYYDASAGEGTCVYIVDSGIKVDHPEFGGRAKWVASFIDNAQVDENGHGTHVAGIVGSATFGVAKRTQLFAIRVLGADGTGSVSGVIAGIDAVLGDSRKQACPNGVVVNTSLGVATSNAMNAAVDRLSEAGILVVTAAGNENQDARRSSPGSADSACTVGATDITNTRAQFSNYGPGVDILAPGVDVVSTWIDGGSSTKSGTSMASPHVAGLAAYLMTLTGIRSPSMCDFMRDIGYYGIIDNLHGEPNVLAGNGYRDGITREFSDDKEESK